MTTVSLEAAQLLKAAGYPQDQWPQMVWCQIYADQEPELDYWQNGVTVVLGVEVANIAAPDPLTALMWLETKGWAWKRDTEGWKAVNNKAFHAWCGAGHNMHSDRCPYLVLADNHDALIIAIAICERLTAMGTKAVVVE